MYDALEEFAREGRLAAEIETDREEGYLVMLGIKFDRNQADQVVKFYRQFGDYLADERVGIYGNSEAAIEAVAEKDILGAHRAGEWAVNTGKVMEHMTATGDESFYKEAVHRLGASTLQAVSFSERDVEERPEKYRFYHDMVKELGEPGISRVQDPIEIDVTEEPEIDYKEAVSGTVVESKERVRELESGHEMREEDYRKLLEAEEEKEDSRVTLSRFLEKRIEEKQT